MGVFPEQVYFTQEDESDVGKVLCAPVHTITNVDLELYHLGKLFYRALKIVSRFPPAA